MASARVNGMKTTDRGLLPALDGHAWTVWPHLRDWLRPPAPGPAVPWRAEVHDPRMGRVALSGWIDHLEGADALVVIVHGMGGCAERPYCVLAAAQARRAGMSSLRLNLRGADGTGEDFYHIGLCEDLAVALAHPEVARYRRVYALGFSLGGHLSLRHAAVAGPAGGLRAVAAVSAPIDLEAGVCHIDRARAWPYRRHVLAGVKDTYRRVAARRPVPLPVAALRHIQTVRAWDEHVVAPRFGFAGAVDYYRTVGVGPLLKSMEVPTLYLAGLADPMVPAATVRPALERASDAVEVHWVRGGHVGFPGRIEILRGIMDWLGSH